VWCGDAAKKAAHVSYETYLLERTLRKIAGLLHVGFGEAGVWCVHATHVPMMILPSPSLMLFGLLLSLLVYHSLAAYCRSTRPHDYDMFGSQLLTSFFCHMSFTCVYACMGACFPHVQPTDWSTRYIELVANEHR
jgi:hypothetical protein